MEFQTLRQLFRQPLNLSLFLGCLRSLSGNLRPEACFHLSHRR